MKVSCVLVVQGDGFLLSMRSVKEGSVFDIPNTEVDPSETSAEAAVRACLEQTGISIKVREDNTVVRFLDGVKVTYFKGIVTDNDIVKTDDYLQQWSYPENLTGRKYYDNYVAVPKS